MGEVGGEGGLFLEGLSSRLGVTNCAPRLPRFQQIWLLKSPQPLVADLDLAALFLLKHPSTRCLTSSQRPLRTSSCRPYENGNKVKEQENGEHHLGSMDFLILRIVVCP